MFQQEEPNSINNLLTKEGALFNFPQVPINFSRPIPKSAIPSIFSGKYRKRKDLTSEIRVRIGITAASNPSYGKIILMI